MIGIVLISHGSLASGLRQAAEMIMGPQEELAVLELAPAQDMEAYRRDLEELIAQVNRGHGVLVLADLFGGSPANASAYVVGAGVEVVCGANLPMLLEILNVRGQQDLRTLAATAVRAGATGTVRLADMLNH